MRDEESTLNIDDHGNKEWRNKSGMLHRLDGPAIETTNGNKEWWKNGKLHRIEGPAIEYSNEIKIWCYRDRPFETKEYFFEALTDEEKEIALFSEDFHNG